VWIRQDSMNSDHKIDLSPFCVRLVSLLFLEDQNACTSLQIKL
jgi:hypothetical protein